MSLDETINLKLIGKNQEDLKVISAYLQDSVVTVKDMVFLKNNRNPQDKKRKKTHEKQCTFFWPSRN